MNDFMFRQLTVLRNAISDYRGGLLDLNSLIQRIVGIGDVLEMESWKDAVFPIIVSMEQINAAVLDGKPALTEADQASIERSICEIEQLISDYESQ